MCSNSVDESAGHHGGSQGGGTVETALVTLDESEVGSMLREADPGVPGEPTVSPEVGCEAVESAEADDTPGNTMVDTEVSNPSGLAEVGVEELWRRQQQDASLCPLFARVVEPEKLEELEEEAVSPRLSRRPRFMRLISSFFSIFCCCSKC